MSPCSSMFIHVIIKQLVFIICETLWQLEIITSQCDESWHIGMKMRFIMSDVFQALFFLKNYLFLAALGLRCCARAFSSCGERGLLFVAVRRLLIVVASLVAEHGLQARGLQQLWLSGSRVQAQQLWRTGLSCSAACGIFPDQGSNPCPLHWQADS